MSLANLGRYNIAKSIAGTFDFANLGFRFGLDRKLPASNNDELNQLRLSICILINTICSFLILLFFAVRYSFDWFYLFFGIGGAFISSFTLIRIYLRGINKVDLFIKVSLYGGIFPLFLQIIGLYFFGLKGLGIAFFIAAVGVFIYYQRLVSFSSIAEIKRNKKYIPIFFKVGSIVYLTNFFAFIANNFDRFIIESMVGLEQVGEYGIIILVFSLSLIIPGSVLEMVFPEYIKDKKNPELIKGHIIKHLKISIGLIALFIIAAYIMIPIAIPILFEKYAYLVNEMQLILLALIPYIFINPIYAILFAFDKHQSILWANVLSSVIYLISLVLVLQFDFSLNNLVYLKLGYTLINLILMGCFLFYNRKAIFVKRTWIN